LQPLYTDNDAVYNVVGNDGETLYLHTTRDAPRGRIVAARFSDPSPDNWQEVVPQGEGVIGYAMLAKGKLVVQSEVAAKSRVDLYATDGKHLGKLGLPGIGAVSGMSGHPDSPDLYFRFASFLSPSAIYHYNVDSAERSTFFKPEIDFDSSKYVTEQVFYKSKDGTQVPMFITHRKGLKLNGKHPTILYGYGGFNITIKPRFNPVYAMWLDMGGVYAVANLRGGGTYGEDWHQAGMLGNKQNVFDDFAWAAKYLVKEKYTSRDHLGIMGYSNGGLLVGASITERPELFGAAYAGAGVLDMLRYQHFSGGDLWAPEYGRADDKDAFQWLYKYSPLHNVKEGTCYPPTIITTADHDDRVVPSHSYKFAAALQHAQGCSNPVLIHIETETSHGYMPTNKRIAQTADVWAFEAYNLGIRKAPRGD
ncbi:MAG: prolyl oligopeptidase family serine peptidase, partial [Gammaproteobacteria bacterium]